MSKETTMTETKNNRWKLRFINFEKAFKLLEKSIQIENPTETERAGIIQFFEMTFELSWKLLKDYLEAEGYSIKSPRQAFKQAVQSEIIADGHQWMQALDDRNLTVHTYDEDTAKEVEEKISSIYFPILKALYISFKNKIESE